jgi:hypothetical protein
LHTNKWLTSPGSSHQSSYLGFRASPRP